MLCRAFTNLNAVICTSAPAEGLLLASIICRIYQEVGYLVAPITCVGHCVDKITTPERDCGEGASPGNGRTMIGLLVIYIALLHLLIALLGVLPALKCIFGYNRLPPANSGQR
jgi:hypothetical protein